MAVSRHLGYYRTANSAIRSADPENSSQEPNMEWIGCTFCEIFAFKLYCDLETGVWGHSRSSKMAPFDRARTTLYSSSIVTMPLSLTVSENIAAYWSKVATSLYLAPPLGATPSDLRNDPWWRKTTMMGLSDSERISLIRSAVLIQYTRVTDGRTDGIGVAYTRYSIMLSRVKIIDFTTSGISLCSTHKVLVLTRPLWHSTSHILRPSWHSSRDIYLLPAIW